MDKEKLIAMIADLKGKLKLTPSQEKKKKKKKKKVGHQGQGQK